MRIALAGLLFLSLGAWAQNAKEFFYSWNDDLSKKYHLDTISRSGKDALFKNEELRSSSGAQIFLTDLDSNLSSFNLQYSHNFDEVGYSLTVLAKEKFFFVFMNEGDHCCDWLVHFDAYMMKKGKPIPVKPSDFWPEISWSNYLEEVPSSKEFPFLSLPPRYYLSYDGEYIHAYLAAEFYALEYDKGPEFLDLYGPAINEVKLKWEKRRFVFE